MLTAALLVVYAALTVDGLRRNWPASSEPEPHPTWTDPGPGELIYPAMSPDDRPRPAWVDEERALGCVTYQIGEGVGGAPGQLHLGRALASAEPLGDVGRFNQPPTAVRTAQALLEARGAVDDETAVLRARAAEIWRRAG